jgi:hypothetical protein
MVQLVRPDLSRFEISHRLRMSASNRDVSDIPREELEELVVEFGTEVGRRAAHLTSLRADVTMISSKVTAAEASVQDESLHYLVPPSALRPNYARPYVQLQMSSSAEEEEEDGEQCGTRRHRPQFQSQPPDSFNPFQGATRRIVALRQRIGILQQQIVEVHTKTVDHTVEREHLRVLLEQRGPPMEQRFHHEKPIPKHVTKKSRVTFKGCVKYSDELLKREKGPDLHDELLCVYWLLTVDDLRAFDILEHIWAPNVKDEDLARLDDLLQDREAHVSILREQYRHLEARHNPLSYAYRDLRGRINHIVDDDGQSQSLAERIAELEKKIQEIPDRQKKIEELIIQRDGLLEEKERLFKKAGADAAELEAKARQEVAEISATKAEVEREKQQLEEVDVRIRERYTTIVEELRRLKEIQLELRRLLEDRDAEKTRKHERLQMLENAGVRTASEVAEVWKLCRETMPRRLWENAQAKESDGRAALKKLTDVRKDANGLKQKNKWMAEQIDRYHLMISNAKRRKEPIPDA